MTTTSVTRSFLEALTDLLLPASCGGCGAAAPGWCPACDAATGGPFRVRLPRAGPVAAAGRYTGPLRRALLRYKERGRRDLAPALARLLVPAVAEVVGVGPSGPVWLVGAPSRPSAARGRGGDHVHRLCRALAVRLRASGLDARPVRLLALDRGARDSVGLDARARASNLAGALRALPDRCPGTAADAVVLLVDDVVTTGATLRACRAALRGIGIRVHAAVALCDATGPRSHPGAR